MKAVVADDDAARRAAVAGEIARHGHEVVEVADTGELLAAAAHREAGLVVCSWTLGEDDGLRLTGDLHATTDVVDPVVVLVGAAEEVDVEAALAAGAADVWAVEAGEGPGDVAVRIAIAGAFARLQAENLRVGGEFALMRQALDLSGTGFVLTDPELNDNPIVYANESFYALTGYTPDEVLGRNCRFLQGEATDPKAVEVLRRAIARREPATVELINYRHDGTPFHNEVHIAPVHDARGDLARFVGVQVDVTAYRDQERRLATERRGRRRAEAAERRSAFLAAASSALDARLDLTATLESLTRLSVPELADLCVVETIRGGEVRRVACAAADPALERLVGALPAAYGIDPGSQDEAIARVARSGEPEVLADRALASGGRALQELLDRRIGPDTPRRWMLLPLRARERAPGVLGLAALDPRRRFGAEELRLAEELAARAALALDNARLYEEQLDVARKLQSSFLPHSLPRVPGLTFAARARAADAAADIGGDFYDVIALDDGGVALSVGDVTGKGAAAAAVTGLARHALRVGWCYEHEPAGVVGTLNKILVSERNDRGRYCTAVQTRLDRVDGGVVVRAVCAGHPPPYVLRADGSIEVLGERGTILGWIDDPRLPEARTVLAPGDTLVAFSDGVSAGDSSGPLSDEALRRELRRWHGAEPDVLAEQILYAALRAQLGRPPDDVVVVVARADADPPATD